MWAFSYIITWITWHDICAHKIFMSKLFFVCFILFCLCHQLTRYEELNFEIVEFLQVSSVEGRSGRGIELKTSWIILTMIRKTENGSDRFKALWSQWRAEIVGWEFWYKRGRKMGPESIAQVIVNRTVRVLDWFEGDIEEKVL